MPSRVTAEIGIGPLVNLQVSPTHLAIDSVLMFAELLELVRASLRVKTAALAEDNWMYEAEDEPLPTQ